MLVVVMCISFLAWQGTISMAKTLSRKELLLSKFQSDLVSLNLTVDLLRLDTVEIQGTIAEFNTKVINKLEKSSKADTGINNSSQDNVHTTLNGTKENGSNTTENVAGDLNVEENQNENKIKQLIKAFHDENLFYQKIVNERKEFRDTLQRELDTAIDFLTEKQRNMTRDLRAKINKLEQSLEECAAQRNNIDALEYEISDARKDSELKARTRKEQYNTLDTKVEQFIRNASEHFVTEEEFNEEQKKQSEQEELEMLVSQCDGSWVLDYQLKTCFLLITKVKNWDNATSFCANHGGQLLQIENAEKNEHVKEIFEESGKHWGKGWVGFWAGGSDINSEGAWEWMADGQTFNYTQWDEGPLFGPRTEPNGNTTENCLSVLLWNSWSYFKWNDADCADEMPFICEKILKIPN